MQSEVLAKKVFQVEIILGITFVQLSPQQKYTITIKIINDDRTIQKYCTTNHTNLVFYVEEV